MSQHAENIIGLISVAVTLTTVMLVVVAMAFSRSEKVVKPTYYQMGYTWTFGPLLISAVDEPDVGPHLNQTVSNPIKLIGGGAHGKW